MEKNTRIIFRISESEKAAAERAAKSEGKNVSEFLRNAIIQASKKLEQQSERGK